MNLTSVIASFATGTYNVTRRESSTYDGDGHLEPPMTSALAFTGCVQPTSGKDLKRLPEGLQSEEVKTLWSPVSLQVKDLISIEGEDWEVQVVERWDTLGAYWRAFAVKVNFE